MPLKERSPALHWDNGKNTTREDPILAKPPTWKRKKPKLQVVPRKQQLQFRKA